MIDYEMLHDFYKNQNAKNMSVAKVPRPNPNPNPKLNPSLVPNHMLWQSIPVADDSCTEERSEECSQNILQYKSHQQLEYSAATACD